MPLALDANGIGENEWTPPRGSPMGDYDISAKIGQESVWIAQSVRVDEYRLPTMRATVTGPRTPVVRAKNVPVDLFVGFLSGGGSPGAPVRLRTAYETYWDSPDGWEEWSFGGSAVREGTVPVDEEYGGPGRPDMPAAATIPLSLDANGALRTMLDVAPLEEAARMMVEMDYQDANGEILTASTSIPIHLSAVRLGI